MIVVYTDGACRLSGGGPGGWAFLADGELVSGGLRWTTNNAAELWAIWFAILHVEANTNVLFVTDSRNVIGWLQRDWNRRQPHINELCLMITDAKREKGIKWAFKKVKGHAQNESNNIVDHAATNEALKLLRQL